MFRTEAMVSQLLSEEMNARNCCLGYLCLPTFHSKIFRSSGAKYRHTRSHCSFQSSSIVNFAKATKKMCYVLISKLDVNVKISFVEFMKPIRLCVKSKLMVQKQRKNKRFNFRSNVRKVWASCPINVVHIADNFLYEKRPR